MLMKMMHYVTKTSDGLVHVQNMVAGHHGQHHVHTEQGYENWKRLAHFKVSDDSIEILKGDKCDCGLKAGDTMEHDGKLWHDDKWENAKPEPTKKVKVKLTKQTKLRW